MDIIFEDKYLLALNKPSGELSQTETSGTYLIHRLDRPVGGVLLLAKDKNTAADLNTQMQKNKIEKKYLAAVSGQAEGEKELRDYIVKNGRLNISQIANKNKLGAKEAVLRYKAISFNEEENATLLEVYLITGRHHQIRVQLSALNHYILGDGKYGKNSAKYPFVGLFSKEISFKHPKTKEFITLNAPFPKFSPFNIFELIYNKG